MAGVRKGLAKRAWPKGPDRKSLYPKGPKGYIKKGTSSTTISQDKAFKILEWILFIGFTIVAGWFASGVLDQYFSHKTSFSQHEEKNTISPVVAIVFWDHKASEVNLTNVAIVYKANGMKESEKLKIGKNYFHNNNYNNTEKVILESIENYLGKRAFKIIHETPMLEGSSPSVKVKIYTKLEKKNDSGSDVVNFYLISLNNSPGLYGDFWKDGKPFQISMSKNTQVKYNIETQMTNYLEQTRKCQKESYYECIVSQIDAIEFNKCSNKCIPEIFSNMGKNYKTPFCQNNTHNRQCVFKHMSKWVNSDYLNLEVGSNCKKSCFIKEYVGEPYLNTPKTSDKEDQDLYYFKFKFNKLASTKDEYLIYDAIGMVGSVGGTLGIFIKF